MKSSWKKSDGTAGDWTWTAGKWFGDAEGDKGIQTGPDARFFAIGAPFAKPVDTTGKPLVVQVRALRNGGAGAAGGALRRQCAVATVALTERRPLCLRSSP